MLGSLLLRLLNPFSAPDPTVSDLVPHLWGIGALVVIVLTRAWAPTIAWCAAVIGSTASALGAVGLVREVMADNGGTASCIGALVVVALLVPPAIAAAYATHDGRRPRALAATAWLLAIGLGSLLVVNFLVRTLGGERGGVPEWAWLGVIGVLLAVGLARDLRPALTRTASTGRGR